MAGSALIDQRQVLSDATTRSIKLLQPILPLVSSLAAANYAHPRSKRKERDFWVQVLTPCHLIEKAGDGVGLFMLDHDPDDLMDRILRILELMVDSSLLPNSGEFALSEYPRLENVRKTYLECDKDDGKEAIVSSVHLLQPESTQACERLTSHLSELVELLQEEVETPVPETSSVIVARRRLMSPIISDMFTTMSRFLGCTINHFQHQHQAALPLFTHKGHSPDDESIVFTILFSISHKVHQWREASITVEKKQPIRTTKVRIAPTGTEAEPDASKALKAQINSLCRVINGNELSSLNLGIDGNLLFRGSAEQLHPGLHHGEMVSLTDGILTSARSKLHPKIRICVALALSYSFVDFCGDSWFPPGWSRDSIYLMQRDTILSLRPHLQTQITPMMRPIRNKAADPSETRLLYHGLLLMEIFFQEPLEISASSKENLHILRKEVRDHFDDRSTAAWDIHEQFRQTVQTCIMGDLHLSTSEQALECQENLSQVLCEKIIAPLETEFQAYWGSDDLDEVISTLELPAIKPSVTTEKSKALRTFQSLIPVRRPKKGAVSGIQNRTHDTIRVSSGSKFFDADDTIEPREILGAQKFFEHFAESAHPRLPSRPDVNNRRVRVAVLDTGIDLENIYISPHKKRIKCWPESHSCRDETGHGTDVAFLLLKFAPHIILHVHKVSRSSSLKDANISAIAEAIRFSSTGDNKVDIINLSFGFLEYSDTLEPIKDAICYARDNKVLIFAAAGNEGLNKSISWPARLNAKVIGIGASNGYGTTCGFSSNNGTTSMISTLGEGVPSCSVNSRNEQIHRNGTSFATPIAVAIAALVLQFMDNLQVSNSKYPKPPDFGQRITRLRTKEGMEKVLRKTCVFRESTIAYITPWHFVEKDEPARFYAILEILRNVLE